MIMSEDLNKDVIGAIKKTGNNEKVKLIGLYKQLKDMYAEEEIKETKENKASFKSFTLIKGLFNEALKMYQGETQLNKEKMTKLKEIFTEEEWNSMDFDAKITTPQIDSLWLTMLSKIEVVRNALTEEDKKIMKHLKFMEVFKFEDSRNFSIEFIFEENEYFSNNKIRIDTIHDNGDESGETIAEIKCDKIEWKEKKDVRHVETKEKPKHRKGKKLPAKVTLERTDSFFWIFQDYKRPDDDEVDDEDIEEMEKNMLSDDALFALTSDLLNAIQNSFYVYIIPAMLGIDVFFFIDPMLDVSNSEDMEKTKGKQLSKEEGEKQCKQQ